ncbi:hypothetical protein JTB14_034322 [Gonioctena quinquepunctata]|nr:hypothetical protein JTB14_034322 [Gonioctena quinquepunctata]
MHNDLNETRGSEKEVKDMLNVCLLEKNTLMETNHDQQRRIDFLTEEKEKLTREVNHVNALCEKILSDFESNIKSSMEKEELYKKEIRESKQMILNNSREMKQLSSVLAAKQDDLQNLKNQTAQQEQKQKQYLEVIKNLENQEKDIKEIRNRNEELENGLSEIESLYADSKSQLSYVKQELESVYKQLNIVMEQKEGEYQFYRKHIDETSRQNEVLQGKNQTELDELKLGLDDLTQKLENERSAYAALSQIHKDISAKFINSIKDVVDEKNARQEAAAKLKDAQENLDILNTEKADLQQQVNILLDGLNNGKNRINTLTQERDNCQNSLDELQKKYNDMLQKVLSLENQIRNEDFNIDTETLKDEIEKLRKESDDNQNLIYTLRRNISDLNQQITGLEFQKSELTLRLHEIQRKFETEKGLAQQLKNTHRLILAAVLKMKNDGYADDPHCNNLLLIMKSNSCEELRDVDEI